jgi:hypothetical protein
MRQISRLLRWRHSWKEATFETRQQRAQTSGHHPFGPGKHAPYQYVSDDEVPPYDNPYAEFWNEISDIVEWTRLAAGLPTAYWSVEFHGQNVMAFRDRRVTFLQALRALHHRPFMQFAACPLDRHNDNTYYFPEQLILLAGNELSGCALFAACQLDSSMQDRLNEQVKSNLQTYISGINEQLKGQSKYSLKALEKTINAHASFMARERRLALAIEDTQPSYRHSSWSSGWYDSSWSTGWIDYSQHTNDDAESDDTIWTQRSEWRDTSLTAWRSSSSGYGWSDR